MSTMKGQTNELMEEEIRAERGRREACWRCGGKEEKFAGALGKRPNSCSGVGHGPLPSWY